MTKFGVSPNEDFILEEFEALKEYLSELNKMLSRLEMIKAGQKERLEFLENKNFK